MASCWSVRAMREALCSSEQGRPPRLDPTGQRYVDLACPARTSESVSGPIYSHRLLGSPKRIIDLAMDARKSLAVEQATLAPAILQNVTPATQKSYFSETSTSR